MSQDFSFKGVQPQNRQNDAQQALVTVLHTSGWTLSK